MPGSPRFVTFTGVDDKTDLDAMIALSALYPIEWGVLVSASPPADERYPRDIDRIVGRAGECGMALHICGQLSRDLMEGSYPKLPWDIWNFRRVQVNHRAPVLGRVEQFGRDMRVQVIIQTASRFPDSATADCLDILFDASGGRGVTPKTWPRRVRDGRLIGFAGGIGPENVLQTMISIDDLGPYWIDMETKVRTDGWLDLEKCRAVCEVIWGKR